MTERKKRQTSPRPNKSGRKNPIASDLWKAKWADPETRERWLAQRAMKRELRKHTYKKPSRIGVPDGMRKDEAVALWDKAKAEAKRFIQIMTDKGLVNDVVIPGSEEEMAKNVLENAYAMAVGPLTDAKTRAGYQRLVLEYTKAKPESKSKLTLENSAEWLSALAQDMPKKDASGGTE